MRSIMVLNAKGGSGKSTVATNLAAYYAQQGKQVMLADYDPQESSLEWLQQRPAGGAEIKGVAAHSNPVRPSKSTDIVIFDVPASVHGGALAQLVKRAQTILVPVLPSPIDMRACSRFLKELQSTATITNKQAKIGIIANRARGNTNIFLELDEYLDGLRGVTYLTALRDSTNYIRAAERGLGIFDLNGSATEIDREEWQPVIDWLDSKKSQP